VIQARFHFDDGHAATIGYRYFLFNETPVKATLEADAADPHKAARWRLADTMKVIQGIDDRLDPTGLPAVPRDQPQVLGRAGARAHRTPIPGAGETGEAMVTVFPSAADLWPG
jgi:hypothetical protein